MFAYCAICHAFKVCTAEQLFVLLQDEMLAHRLGLVPLQVDPNLFEWKQGETFGPLSFSRGEMH